MSYLNKTRTLILKGVKEPEKIFPFLYEWPYFKYLQFKYRNKPYTDFYKEVMKKRIARDPMSAIGGKWEEVGKLQFNYLIDKGLKKQHKILDFGCGCLRAGLYLIEYLDKGNYWGLDISPEILRIGKKYITERGIGEKNPKLILDEKNNFGSFVGVQFDFIIAQSVLTHMPMEDIERLFNNVLKNMKSGCQFFATYHESYNDYHTPDRQNFFYPFSCLQSMGNERGLDVEEMNDYIHPRNHKMLRITRRT